MLYKHQTDAIEFACRRGGNAAIFHDPGLGKTRTALEIFTHLRAQNPALKMLVISPLSLINAAWGEDIKKFTQLRYKPWSEIDRVNEVMGLDIIGINYESMIVEARFRQIQNLLLAGPWLLVVDESSRMKSHNSKTTKCLLQLAKYARHRIIMSGTPCPNLEDELWAQANFVDPHCFEGSFFAFRNHYFYLGRGKQIMEMRGRIMTRGMMSQIFQNGWKYQITDASRKELMARMSFAHWVKKEDALDLPEKIDEIRLIRLNPNERKAYNEMKTHLVAEIKTGRTLGGEKETRMVTAEVALAKLMKLRQCTSGFLYDENHAALRPGRSSKMRELAEVLEELGNKQVIIWINFRFEVDAITDMLREQGKTFATLYSGTEDRDDSIKGFQEGRYQILVANSHSAAHGLTFVNCSNAIYFSLDYSYESWEQSRNRLHRIGQVNKCLYITLIAENSIDQMVLQVLQRKKTLQDIIYELTQQEAKEPLTGDIEL